MEQLARSRWIKRSTQKKNKKTNCLGGVLNDNGHAYVIDCEETVWSFGHCSLMACLEAMIRIPSGSGGRGGQGARLLTAQHFPVLDSHGWHPSSTHLHGLLGQLQVAVIWNSELSVYWKRGFIVGIILRIMVLEFDRTIC